MADQKWALTKNVRKRSCALTSAFMVIVIMLLEVAIKQILRARAIDQANKVFLKHFVDGAIEDLLDLTDSEESTSSSNNGVFEAKPFVLELHDLVKDDPEPEDRQEEPKVKRLRKKKKAAKQQSNTSSSDSESSVPPSARSKEEFYDAHESYHGLAASAAIMQAVPENGLVLKTSEQTATAQKGSASQREPTTAITKPPPNPE